MHFSYSSYCLVLLFPEQFFTFTMCSSCPLYYLSSSHRIAAWRERGIGRAKPNDTRRKVLEGTPERHNKSCSQFVRFYAYSTSTFFENNGSESGGGTLIFPTMTLLNSHQIMYDVFYHNQTSVNNKKLWRLASVSLSLSHSSTPNTYTYIYVTSF